MVYERHLPFIKNNKQLLGKFFKKWDETLRGMKLCPFD
jgi:hypothetical protein